MLLAKAQALEGEVAEGAVGVDAGIEAAVTRFSVAWCG